MLKLKLPKIYPITDVQIAGMSIIEQVEQLVEGGATFIQLREKTASSHDFYNEAAAAVKFAREHNVRIIINDRVDIALALKADGVHLGQDDLPCTDARHILGDDAIIGLSTHSAEQVTAALRLPIDYIAVGPVFQTTTKPNPDPAIGLDGIAQFRKIAGDLPLVAIGGITISKVTTVLDAGADSAAVIRGIVSKTGDIAKAMRTFLNTTNALNE